MVTVPILLVRVAVVFAAVVPLGGAGKLTVGADVYPLPGFVTMTDPTPLLMFAVAVAPLPPPRSEERRAGEEPLPPLVMVTAPIPLVSVAVIFAAVVPLAGAGMEIIGGAVADPPPVKDTPGAEV